MKIPIFLDRSICANWSDEHNLGFCVLVDGTCRSHGRHGLQRATPPNTKLKTCVRACRSQRRWILLMDSVSEKPQKVCDLDKNADMGSPVTTVFSSTVCSCLFAILGTNTLSRTLHEQRMMVSWKCKTTTRTAGCAKRTTNSACCTS